MTALFYKWTFHFNCGNNSIFPSHARYKFDCCGNNDCDYVLICFSFGKQRQQQFKSCSVVWMRNGCIVWFHHGCRHELNNRNQKRKKKDNLYVWQQPTQQSKRQSNCGNVKIGRQTTYWMKFHFFGCCFLCNKFNWQNNLEQKMSHRSLEVHIKSNTDVIIAITIALKISWSESNG